MKKTFLLLLLGFFLYGETYAFDFSAVAPSGQRLYYNISGNCVTVTYPYYPPNYYISQYGFNEPTGNLTIPSSVTHNGITYSVTSIGYCAFNGCNGLTSVTVPNSVTTIGQSAFNGCSGLTSVTIPNSVTTIGQAAFVGCSSLTTVTIPNSVTSINDYAFQNCSGLTSISIGSSVVSIGSYAFKNCSGLTSVIIPNSVTSMNGSVFYGCSGLTSIVVESGNTIYDSRDNCNAIVETSTNTLISGCMNTTIPNSVTSIGFGAFEGCSGLTSVTIPNSVIIINNEAFKNCSGLITLTIPNSVTAIGNEAFSYCSGLTSIVVESGNTIYDSRDNCDAIVETSTNTLISGCMNTTISNSVTSIGNEAFFGCSGLTSVTIPNSVTTIGSGAFACCSGLSSVTIGNSVTLIGACAFEECSNLTSVTIPSSVTLIHNLAFMDCSGLTEIICLASTAPTLLYNVFSNVSSSIPVYIPCGSTTSYQSVWTYFSNFSEVFSTYILDLQADNEMMGSVNVTSIPDCQNHTAVITATPNYGYHFTQWSDGNTNNPRTITLTQDTLIAAYFTKNQYAINGVPSHSNRGSVFGGGMVDYLDSVTLIASANYGYHFDHWNDLNTDNPRQIQATQDQTYTAYFIFNQYSIFVGVDTSIHGNCLGGGSYNYLSNRTITANANYGYHFTQWNDGNTNNPRTITLTQDTSFTAQFAKNQYTVNVAASHTDRGSVTGGGTVDYLDSVTVTATANYGYHFDHWNDMNTDTLRQVLVTQNQTYTAYFDYNQYSISLYVDTIIHGNCLGGGSYNYLSNRTITANANYGYHFTQWNDGNTNNPRTITLTQDTSFTAQFAKNQYTVNVAASHTDRGCVTGGGTVDYLDSVTVTATANYGYHFDHWNDMNTDTLRQVLVTQNQTYTAYFDYNQYSISLYVDTIIHGNCLGGGSYNYLSNRTITANANYGYHFTQWNDGNTNNPRTITLTQDTSFTAQFAKNQYTVNVAASHTDRGCVTGGGTVDYLDSVTVTATANYGYHFDHWSDGSTNNPHTIAVTQNVTITAYFEPDLYTIAMQSANPSYGYVEVDSIRNFYLSSNTFSAISNYGYHFTYWNDGVAESTRTITLTQDTSFTAYFAPNQYNLTAVSADETMGTVSGGGTYDYGNIITVTATPAEHYHFLHWNDGNTENPRNIEIQGDYTLTAFFAIDTHTVIVSVNDIARGMVEVTGTEFVYGTPCTVTATAYSGYEFVRWSNGETYNPYTFAVVEDMELTAIFEAEGTQGTGNIADHIDYKVYTKNSCIYIDGIEGQSFAVYSIDGRLIAARNNAIEQEAIPVPSTGLYFIKIGEYPARKVVVVR